MVGYFSDLILAQANARLRRVADGPRPLLAFEDNLAFTLVEVGPVLQYPATATICLKKCLSTAMPANAASRSFSFSRILGRASQR